jgi:hypothetical protein
LPSWEPLGVVGRSCFFSSPLFFSSFLLLFSSPLFFSSFFSSFLLLFPSPLSVVVVGLFLEGRSFGV